MVRAQVREGDASSVDLAVGSRLSLMVQAVGPCSTSLWLSYLFTFISRLSLQSGTPASRGRARNVEHCYFGLILSTGFCLTDFWSRNISKLYYLSLYF